MDEQEFNKREQLARLDAYFGALKEVIPSEAEEENDEKD